MKIFFLILFIFLKLSLFISLNASNLDTFLEDGSDSSVKGEPPKFLNILQGYPDCMPEKNSATIIDEDFEFTAPLKMLLPHKSFYFLQHGETDWNKENKVMGQTNIPLNENGIFQAQVIAEKIKFLVIDLIVSSPLKRAKETAEIISKKIGKPLIVGNDLQECCWGVMEGQLKKDCSYNSIPFEPEEWWQQGIIPKDAESFT